MWTIGVSALLVALLVWVVFLRYPDFNQASQLGSTIGGIAGPLLSFSGLLIVYFSLREQFHANQIQLRNFRKEQKRSNNENTISTAFKILDDLRAEARRIAEQTTLLSAYPSGYRKYIDFRKYTDFEDVNYEREPRLLDYKLSFEEAAKSEEVAYAFQREVLSYFQVVATETRVFRATFGMLTFLLTNSQLPLAQRIHIYTVTVAIVEPITIHLLNGLEIFSTQNEQVNELVQQVWNMQGELSNSYEALVDQINYEQMTA
jgi:hypothetical protein